ncbi:hypothetical protein [Acinetobacter seifertii]|uniref:hypothetical protein n=1 Tax=Acinetobacter seifertii TaxID=1530123 RepID=UPI0032B33C14
MSKRVWTTTVMREDNLRVFELSFPGKYDYPSQYLLEKNKKFTEEQKLEWEQMMDARLEIKKQVTSFKKLDAEIIPTILYGRTITKDIDFPYFCRTLDGDILINEECANLLKKFRLGETAMYPLSFFDIDLNEPVNNETYYFLNIAEWRNYLLPEFSSKDLYDMEIKNSNYSLYYLLESKYHDNALAVSEKATNCDLDLWHDPALASSIFVSDELKKALENAGMAQDWLFYNCQLITKQ